MTNLSTIIADNNVLTESSTNTVTNKSIDAGQLTGSVAMARLGSGTASSSTFLRGDGTFAAAGLNHFTDSQDTTDPPNGTIPVNAISASGTATNIDLSAKPKGTGAITRDIADNGTTGGEKRGEYAVDFQGHRTNANRVAAGNYSFLGGGSTNGAFAPYSVVSGGYGNYTQASADYSTVVGGRENDATGDYSISGGRGVSATGRYSVGLGYNNTASGTYAAALGYSGTADGSASTTVGYNADAKLRYSILCVGTDQDPGLGNVHQTCFQTLAGQTVSTGSSNDTTQLMAHDTSSANYQYMNRIDSNQAYAFKILVVGRIGGGGTQAAWEITGLVERTFTAAFEGTPIKTAIAASSGASAWDANAVIVSSQALGVEVTSGPGQTVYWTASIWTSETDN